MTRPRRDQIERQVHALTTAPREHVELAACLAWRARHVGTPQERRQAAARAIDELGRAATTVGALTAALQLLIASYPAGHDDDWGPEGGSPGYCQCGRWAETCPSRAAAAAGADEWEAEDGTVYDLATGAEVPPSVEAVWARADRDTEGSS